MQARAEITKEYARAYAAASKKDRGRLLDEVVAVQLVAGQRAAPAAHGCGVEAVVGVTP